MNNLLACMALTLLPLSLSAQTKPAPRKPATATVRTTPARPATVRAITPTKTPATPSATTRTAATSATVAPVAVASAIPAEPVKTQSTSARRPTPQPAPAYPSERGLKIGFRVGANSSTFGGVDVSDLGEGVKVARVMGFHGGVVFNIGGPRFSVQPEVLYTQYGVRLAFGDDYLQLKYNLVEIPVLLKASFGQPKLRVFVNAGPVITYTASGTISVREGGQSDSQSLPMSNEGRLAYGASGGAGVAISAGPGRVQLEGRYTYLMSGNGDDQTKPQNAMLSIGYLLPLGGR